MDHLHRFHDDQQATGLDPLMEVMFRECVAEARDDGRTVFLSSHILSEVERTCDRVAILAKGRAVATGSVTDVLSRGRVEELVVRVGEPDRAVRVLRDAGLVNGHRIAREFESVDPERPRAIIRERQVWGHAVFPKLGDRVL